MIFFYSFETLIAIALSGRVLQLEGSVVGSIKSQNPVLLPITHLGGGEPPSSPFGSIQVHSYQLVQDPDREMQDQSRSLILGASSSS